MALQSARILPLTDLLAWKYARTPGSTLTTVNLVAAVDTASYAARDFELQYRDLVVAGALAEVTLVTADVWGLNLDRVGLPVIPSGELTVSTVDKPASVAFPGAVAHVKPTSLPKDAVTADQDLYARDLLLWEVLAQTASVLTDPPLTRLDAGLALSEAWSLAEGDEDSVESVNPATALSVDLFKRPDRGLAARDNQLAVYVAKAAEAVADLYTRATRLLVKVDDAVLNRDPDLYVLYSDSTTTRVWITEPGLTGRSRIIFDKVGRRLKWVSNYYTDMGVGTASLDQSFGLVNDFEVQAAKPSKPDAEHYRLKTSQLKFGRFKEVPIYYQPSAVLDYTSGTGAFLGPDDVMLSSDDSAASFDAGLTEFDKGVYRYSFLFETNRTIRLYGALNANSWPIVSTTAATITGPGSMSWAVKLEAGSYTLKFSFSDETAATPSFDIEVTYQDSAEVLVYSGVLLYGKTAGTSVTSPTYFFQTDGSAAVLTLKRTDGNDGNLTVDTLQAAPLTPSTLDYSTALSTVGGSEAIPASFSGLSGRYDVMHYDVPLSEKDGVTVTLKTLEAGALYLRAWDIKKIELQRETPDATGYASWKRGWLTRALATVRDSWFTATIETVPTLLEDGLWTANATENWMNVIEGAQNRLRDAFRLGRPSDVGQPALTPIGLSLDPSGAIGLYDETKLEPVAQILQPWMILIGVYVFHEDFWPEYHVPVGGLVAGFTAEATD